VDVIARVWAPHAEVVDVVLEGGSRHRLDAEPAAGWHVGGPELAPGDRYRFSLDGGEALPDPRSGWQPDGIDGPSAVDDPAGHDWDDAGWRGFHLPGSVLYELHVGTFTPDGTFDSAIERLDHLVDLGVDAVELLPVAEAMGERGWGYDGVLLFAPHHVYGGPAGLRRLVDACHQRGLGVLLDVVYNHLGPKGNHLPRFGPYFTDRHHTPWGSAVNLDGPGSPEVRRFVLDNALRWFADFHVDGLRLDATHALLDDSPTHLMAELSAATEALAAHLGRPLWLVAEREQEEVLPVLPRTAGGWGLHARWADDLHHAIHSALTGERDGYYESFGSIRAIADAVTQGRHRPGDDWPADLPAHAAVICSQNHDQVGNRALGDRLAHLVGTDAAMVAAAITLCSPGTPLLFQGEEWAATSPFPYFVDTGGDEPLAEAIRRGRRGEFAAFGWDPDSIPDPVDPATMAAAVLRWDELPDEPHRRVLRWYRDLVALRRSRPDLTDGRRSRTAVEVDEGARRVAIRRGGTVLEVTLDPPRAVISDTSGLILLDSGTASGPHHRRNIAMGVDEAKGRVKEAAGDLTGDKDLQREGKVDQATDKVKDVVDGVKDKVQDVLHKDK
jgi:maltooligosyltrehalose trehalohydrolase